MAQLRIVSGSKSGSVIPLVAGQVFVVGRGAEANLAVPDDPTLSRVHADIVFEAGQWLLRNKSQHGSLVAGQVVHGNVPIPPGVEFQVGGTRMLLEVAPGEALGGAGAPQIPVAGQRPGGIASTTTPPGGLAPPPSGPTPIGSPVGAGAPAGAGASKPAGGGVDAAAAGKALGGGLAAAGAFAAAAGGPIVVDGSAPGIPVVPAFKAALSVVKANLLPSLVVAAPIAVSTIVNVTLQVLGALAQAGVPGIGGVLTVFGLIATIISLAMLLFFLAMPIILTNYMGGVKEFKATGQSFGIGRLLRMDDLVNRYIGVVIVAVSAMCCFIPLLFTVWAIPLLADRPKVPFLNAIKASLAFSKKNLVPTIVFFVFMFVLNFIGGLPCCLGLPLLIISPMGHAALYLCYDAKKAEFDAAAADAGISLEG